VRFVLITGYVEARSSEPELRHAPRVGKPINHRHLVHGLTQLLDTGSG
jgi:hypothetical protein